MSSYFGVDFIGFFGVLFSRLLNLVSGQVSSLENDELQVLVLSLVGISAAILGTFLVLKKMTMLANSLSHTVLFGILVTYLIISFVVSVNSFTFDLKIVFIASLITCLVTSLLTHFLNKVMRLQEDASIGLVFTGLYAIAVVLVTLFTRNSHIGSELIMGNVDLLNPNDLSLSFWTFVANLSLILLFYKQYLVTTFDSAFAKSYGVSTNGYHMLMMFQVSMTVMSALKAVGVVLVLSFLVIPVLTARLLTNRLKHLLLIAALINVFASLLSVATSRHLLSMYDLGISTSGLVSVYLTLIYLITALTKARLSFRLGYGKRSRSIR